MGGSFLNFMQQDPNLNQIKKEINRQDKWLQELHNFSKNLHSYTKYIQESNTKHKKEIVRQVNDVVRWIDYLNESHTSLKKDIFQLKREIRQTLKEDFTQYHNILKQYINHKLENLPEYEDMKQELLDEINIEREYEPVINEEYENNVNNVMHYNAPTDLTNPEEELLTLLFNENKPLTYKKIAEKQNKSVNSIRVYMNSLKSKKGIIDEFKGPNGQKIFTIKNSELVKTLFNL